MLQIKNYMPIKKLFCNQSGMGLAETLVAIAILGIAAVCFVSSLSVGAVSVNALGEQAVAQQLLTSEMESIKAASYDVTGGSYPIVDAPDNYSLTLSVNSSLFSNTNIQKVTASVYHNGVLVEKLENMKGNR
jgi:prepilin-type N-terminal cleavage/methylation domain-containing protein